MSATVALQSIFLLVARYNMAAAARFMIDIELEDNCTLERAIVLINRYWRDNLARCQRDTMDARTYLIDDCSFEDWLSLFERGVIPELLISDRPCHPV